MQAISATTPVAATTADAASTSNSATSAFGLSFESLLKIVLTQLTYQDPLKPVDNFEFVSQLAQFSQIQLGQTTNDKLGALVSAQSTMQAAGLLGRTVDIPSGAAVISGTVTAISFDNGDPQITIKTGDGQTISGLSLAAVSQIREGN
ncbi:flagellar hook assembly protein FlgD [Sphingomonas sp.]|jgi:flagellar basal-body rod modification protein FlgD|uniref:flagellar hook assembly protein FlgD n=1 Tax=Sphingomonas sp. TaxID=28214 RepID=UPI002E34A99E|nr:flagellar hook capping FlgD N-terminal domain-containing protein [Sphingomonas sp.]HEX4695793.1 flagellar hook capping FlgD N-terminal domain-containing protein [Sphingomonas sp.]